MGGGGEIRTLGLRVMSPTRYRCATPLHSFNLWRPHEDSNPELLITKQAFYRLNYGAFSPK